MRTKKNRQLNRFIVLFITVSLLWLHFVFEPSRAFALSIEDEKKLGQKFLAQVGRYFEFVDDDFTNRYINDLGHYLTRPLETRHFPFHFYIVKDNDLNAFAGPGGHIFLFTGLIEVMDRIDDLASVICHEIAHVSARHLSHRIELNKKIGLATMAGVLVGTLIGGEASGAIGIGAAAAGIQKQLSYSRNDERQADQLGYKYTNESGFDPLGMVHALKKLQEGRWLSMNRVPPYLLTHPGGSERISNIEAMSGYHIPSPKSEETNRFAKLFPLFKTILRARYLEPLDAERLFKTELEKDPDSALAHFGLGILWKERSEYPKSIDHFEKSLRRMPESLTVLRHLAEAYQLKGQDQDAKKILEKALKIDEQDKATIFLLATSFQNLEEFSSAINLYEKLTSMKPVKNEVYYHLGLSYGRQGRLGLAHYNFGKYFKRLKKKEKARFHFHKAEELSGKDPNLKQRIREAMKDPP